MLRIFKLLLPAIIPSWRFFDVIAASPRIQYVLLNKQSENLSEWQEYTARLRQLDSITILKRLFWNPHWNEYLFLVSCAERIIANLNLSTDIIDNHHSETEILKRICRALFSHKNSFDEEDMYLQFRLLMVNRDNTQNPAEVVFYSSAKSLTELQCQNGI